MEVIGGRGRHPQGVRRAKGSSASQHKPMKHFMVATFPTRWDFYAFGGQDRAERKESVCCSSGTGFKINRESRKLTIKNVGKQENAFSFKSFVSFFFLCFERSLSASILQSSASHDSSEIILIC